MPGWTITLSDAKDVVRSTVTNDEGVYLFESLPAGTYTITERLQDGWEQTFPSSGVHVAVLALGQIVEGLDFGNTAAVNNLVYLPVIKGR